MGPPDLLIISLLQYMEELLELANDKAWLDPDLMNDVKKTSCKMTLGGSVLNVQAAEGSLQDYTRRGVRY